MSSLGRHLTTPAPHGDLPFHPGCAVCCDARLHGSIPDAPIVPTKVKMSLATALVTVSTAGAAPAASIALDIDEQVEGTELPQPEPELDTPNPGDETRVPDDESVAVPGVDGGDADDDSDGPALESEPEARPAPLETPVSPLPPSPERLEDPVAPPQPPPETAPSDRRPTPTLDREQRADEPEQRSSPRPTKQEPPSSPRDPIRTPSADLPPDPPSLQSPQSLPPDEVSPPAAPKSAAPVGQGAEHVVRPGESLWSIAARLAGDDAAPAKIARIVNRLWTLNADRIGTGDPDLVMAGTTLRLR